MKIERRISYESWLSHEPGLSCLKMAYALTGDSTVEVLNRVAYLFRLDPKVKDLKQVDIDTTLERRDQYRLVGLLFNKKIPKLESKGSNRFFEGKMKANLVYTEQTFEVEDDGYKERLILPFLYERHTGLLFSQMMAEITPKLRLNFIKKVINELQCERISPLQKNIPIKSLFFHTDILEHYRDDYIKGMDSAFKNILDSLDNRNLPLSKNFHVKVWPGYECREVISFDCTLLELQAKLSTWIQRMNQAEIDNIASVTDRNPRYKVKMSKLFPNIVVAPKPKNKRWAKWEI